MHLQKCPKSKICKSFKLKVLRIDQEKSFKLNKIFQLIDEEILSVDETKKINASNKILLLLLCRHDRSIEKC